MILVYPSFPAPVLPKRSYLHPAFEIPAGTEMLPIVEPNGIVIGQSPRSYVHGGSLLLHPVVHLHIINRDGSLYLQKRSMNKDLLPGYWDTAVGGHVAYGEQIVEALYRESGEELHFYDYNPIFLRSYIYESKKEKELVNVYACVGNFTPVPNQEEVEDGRYWSFDEIDEYLGKSVLTPNFEGEFVRIRKSLEALL